MDRSTEKKNARAGRAQGSGGKMKAFISNFFNDIGLSSKDIDYHPLAGDGSTRTFWRMTSRRPPMSYIAMENAPATEFLRRENLAYLKIGEHLFQKGLPVPEIFRYDLVNGWFIMEDLGDESLQACASQNTDKVPVYKKVVEILFRFQIEGSRGFDTSWTCQTERYDRLVMRRYEADYFRDAFLSNYLGLEKDWSDLEGPFDYLAETASKADCHFFLHRDFQSRNIMVSQEKIGIIDWQGGRLGPLAYDLASLLIDPYTALSPAQRGQIFDHYLRLLGDHEPAWVSPFETYFPYLAIQRNLQILGAFAFLTHVKGKTFFEHYIPPALKSLHALLEKLRDRKLLPLMNLLESLLNSDNFG